MKINLGSLTLGFMVGFIICGVWAIIILIDANNTTETCMSFNDELYGRLQEYQITIDEALEGWEQCSQGYVECMDYFHRCQGFDPPND